MKTNKIVRNIVAILIITAFVLTGSTPYFAFAQQEAKNKGPEVTPLATFDDSRVPSITADSAILMNGENGDIIYEKNARIVREPASVTKVLNLLVSVENLDTDQVVTVPDDVERSGTTADFEPGEKVTVEQLMYGMMLVSGNDAAEVLAKTVGGDVKTFSKMMNARAKECGAEATDFKSPNGLNEDANALNYTTAYDLAMITREGMKNDLFRKVVGTARYTIAKTNKQKRRTLYNSNACLRETGKKLIVGDEEISLKYEGCTGVKTGFTTSAGSCYVGTAKRDGMELIVVILHGFDSTSRYADARALWDYGFNHYKTYVAKSADQALCKQKVRRGSLSEVKIGMDEDLAITLDKDYKDENGITTDLKLNEEEPTAPIKKGAVMGTIEAYSADGKLIAVHDLIALEKVEKGGPLSYIGISDDKAWIVYLILGIIVACILALLITRTINHRRRRGKKAAAAKKVKSKNVKQQREREERQEAPQPAEEIVYEQSTRERPRIEPPLREQLENERRYGVSSAPQPSAASYPRTEKTAEERPRGRTRTRAEKRAARKQRARRRKARQRSSDNVRH